MRKREEGKKKENGFELMRFIIFPFKGGEVEKRIKFQILFLSSSKAP